MSCPDCVILLRTAAAFPSLAVVSSAPAALKTAMIVTKRRLCVLRIGVVLSHPLVHAAFQVESINGQQPVTRRFGSTRQRRKNARAFPAQYERCGYSSRLQSEPSRF